MIKHYYFTKEVFEDLEGHGFVYYQVQKFVFDMFMSKELTETAFKIYVLLFDRAKLSAKNGYHDDTGIYVKYTYAELKDKLNVTTTPISNALDLLERKALIKRRHQYVSSTFIYVAYLVEE